MSAPTWVTFFMVVDPSRGSGADGSSAARRVRSIVRGCPFAIELIDGQLAARALAARGVQMRVDGHAERRQSLAEQEQIDVGMGREGLEHAARVDIDVGHRAAELHARGLADVLDERIDGVLEEVVMKVPHAVGARCVGGQPPL
ncbi:MAG: hypothetical protein ACK55I_18770, partial [bacterium]